MRQVKVGRILSKSRVLLALCAVTIALLFLWPNSPVSSLNPYPRSVEDPKLSSSPTPTPSSKDQPAKIEPKPEDITQSHEVPIPVKIDRASEMPDRDKASIIVRTPKGNELEILVAPESGEQILEELKREGNEVIVIIPPQSLMGEAPNQPHHDIPIPETIEIIPPEGTVIDTTDDPPPPPSRDP